MRPPSHSLTHGPCSCQLRRGVLVLAVVGVGMLVPGGSRAQPEAPGSGAVAGRAHVYVDDDHTTIGTGLVDGTVALPADLAVDAHALVDVVSSASVDVVSNASVDVGSAASARSRYCRGRRPRTGSSPS